MSIHGYNLQFEMCRMYDQYFVAKEDELNHLIDNLDATNQKIKTISDLTNLLTHAKKTNKKIDLSSHVQAREWIDAIYEWNPTVFNGNKGYFFKNENEIDGVIQGLDAEIKMLTRELDHHMMIISNKYGDRAQMTEQARKVLDEAGQLNGSIIRKTSNR